MKHFACASGIVLVVAVACDGGTFASSPTTGPAGSTVASFVVQVARPLGGTVVSVDANGKPDGRIRCGSRPADAACGPVAFAPDESVTLAATPEEGFEFEDWAADCSGRPGTCRLDARGHSAGKRVVAIFAPAENTASAAAAPSAQAPSRQ